LGLQVARELLAHFQGQVYFVALAPVRDPELVASTIAKTLGLQESGQRSPLDSLKDYLRAKSLLLVLDNFEQILSAAPQVAELLAASAELKILVTSRAALQIRDEHEYPVLPLALPEKIEAASPQTLSRYAAVILFVERAAAIRPDFTLNADNAATLSAICIRLDGLPLAIELAAARLRLLSPQAMLARLDHSLPLLTGGARDLPRRQQTLRATIAWSYDLLTPAEQRLFQYLSVFVGGCSLDTVEALCQVLEADWPAGINVLDALESLLAMNLLRPVDGAAAEPRYLMLETIREYGLEQLDARGETPILRRHHAEYFLKYVEQADAKLRGPKQAQCLDQLEAEHANIRAALGWSLERDGDAQLGLRMGAVLGWFWRFRGYLSEGRDWAERILTACSDRTVLRSKLLARLTLITYGQGDNKRALTLAIESVAIARELKDDAALGWALHAMGRVLHSSARYEQASVVLEESLERFRAAGDIVGRSYSSWILGDVKRAQGDYQRSAPLMEEGLQFAHQSGDTWALASAYLNAGSLAYRQKDFDRASALLKQSLIYYRNIRALWGVWFPISNLGTVAAAQGYAKRAACLAGVNEVLRNTIGATMVPSHRADYEEGLSIAHRTLSESAFAAAWAKGEAMTTGQAVDYALSSEDEE
jgi:predicted ATPase